MDNYYEGLLEDGYTLDEIVDEEHVEEKKEDTKSISADSDDVEFADAVKELKYQLKFIEFSRKYIKVKIKGKKYKVIPITEFKKSGTFVLQTEDKHVFQARIGEIERWKTR